MRHVIIVLFIIVLTSCSHTVTEEGKQAYVKVLLNMAAKSEKKVDSVYKNIPQEDWKYYHIEGEIYTVEWTMQQADSILIEMNPCKLRDSLITVYKTLAYRKPFAQATEPIPAVTDTIH